MTSALATLAAALPGYEVRGVTTADADATVAVIVAAEIAAHGEAEIERGDVTDYWARPGLDLAGDVVLVLAAGVPVGYGECYGGRAEAYVAPSHRGRGIGTALAAWWLGRAGEHGRTEAGQTVSDDDPGATALLRSLGASRRHTSWVLRIELPAATTPAAPSLPAGYELRDARPGEERAVYDVIETAFSAWPGREPGRYDDWAATAVGRERFEPWMAPVVVRGTEIVAAAILRPYPDEGWIDQLAVARGHRDRGLARALLQHAFGRFHGTVPHVGLSTDSRTGALDLYRHVGMEVRRSYTRWSRTLPA